MKNAIKTVEDIRDYLTQQPPDKWCVDVFHNGAGQSCATGHLFNAGMSLQEIEAIHPHLALKLAFVNNGRDFDEVTDLIGYPERFNGLSIRSRVLNYLNAIIATREVA